MTPLPYQPPQRIDLRQMLREFWHGRRLYYVTLSSSLVITVLILMSLPKRYECQVTISAEGDLYDAWKMNALAASYGFSLRSAGMTTAFHQEMFYEIIKTETFHEGLLDVVVTNGSTVPPMTYAEYLTTRWHRPWWERLFGSASAGENTPEHDITSAQTSSSALGMTATPSAEATPTSDGPHRLTPTQMAARDMIGGLLTAAFDENKMTTTWLISDQDPVICALMADSIRSHLQQYLTQYRRVKIAAEVAFLEQMKAQAHDNYMAALDQYTAYVEAHHNPSREEEMRHIEMSKRDVDMKYTAYRIYSVQLMAAQGHMAVDRSDFITLREPTVPLVAAFPKRKVYLLISLFFTFGATSLWLMRRHIF